jgi:hypothetical protein
MDFKKFEHSLSGEQPPADISVHLEALWNARKGNWQQAHNLIENLPDQQAAHIHAYLHRVEGDEWNADYWYNRAGEKRPPYSLEKEWEFLVKASL